MTATDTDATDNVVHLHVPPRTPDLSEPFTPPHQPFHQTWYDNIVQSLSQY